MPRIRREYGRQSPSAVLSRLRFYFSFISPSAPVRPSPASKLCPAGVILSRLGGDCELRHIDFDARQGFFFTRLFLRRCILALLLFLFSRVFTTYLCVFFRRKFSFCFVSVEGAVEPTGNGRNLPFSSHFATSSALVCFLFSAPLSGCLLKWTVVC